MNQTKRNTGIKRLLAAALILLCLAGAAALYQKVMADLAAQEQGAVRQAVLRCAVQCYSVEGVYPPDLAYMEENYGLIVNQERYIVSYDAFASNLLPQVSVLTK
ncbi:MAG: hypothetical protein LKJ90_03665 [Faecalibacterium sp.]|jgi:hypothetical protein|nr:hypothetical protein [Faecalibacterium sp.]